MSTRIGLALSVLAFAVLAAAVPVAMWAAGRRSVDPLPASGATPAVCVKALDLASAGFDNNADAMDAVRDYTEAVGDGDAQGARRALAAIDATNDRLAELVPEASAASRACRAGAQ